MLMVLWTYVKSKFDIQRCSLNLNNGISNFEVKYFLNGEDLKVLSQYHTKLQLMASHYYFMFIWNIFPGSTWNLRFLHDDKQYSRLAKMTS